MTPPPSAPPTQEELARMSLMEHLEELRKRILWSVLFFAVAFFPCWAYYREIFRFLMAPLLKVTPPNFKLSYLGLSDPFILFFKMAALMAVFVSSPFLLYQIWKFVAPGLYQREKRMALPFVLATTFFFLAGGAFGYYIAFPAAAKFFLGIGQDLNPVITADTYFGFLMTVIFGLGLMFELPVLVLILAMLGVVTPKFLLKYFRHAIVVIFIVAAIITPTPDVVNLCIFAIPACGLYVLGILGAMLAARFRRKRAEAAGVEDRGLWG
ncbi:MAG TPA: twin-arginine translocase subunit TatC [Thermoanaerobaculia bacterium]|nr:twin-arginine translocase subunit TatC [Thermoanaerobaculia bacterium]